MGYPCVPRRPPPSLSLYKQASEFIAGRLPIYCSGLPHPARASCRQAPHTLLPGHPHPTRAFGAPPPPPPRGRGPCVAISGEQPYPGWSRWEAVSGSFPGSPHALDRGDIATGGGADGEGELVPPPLSLTLPLCPAFGKGCPYSSGTLPSHPALSQGIPVCSLPAPPPHPRLRRSSPAPVAGAGSVRGDIRGAAVSGSSPAYSRALDRGDIATGGGADGEGERVPPPLSLTLQPSYFSPASLARASCRLSIRSLPAPPPPVAISPRSSVRE